MPATTPPRMFSIAETADHLSVSTKSIRRWVHAGQLHVHRLGRQIRIAEEDLAAFLAIRRR